MGGGASIDESGEGKEQKQLQSEIEQNLKNRRLKLNHQSNIFEKCEYLKAHYKKYEPDFEELYLSHNMISEQTMSLISKMELGNLKTLSLSYNDINCQALKCVKDMPLKSLEYLFLGDQSLTLDHNQIANDGCYYLTRTNLQSLLTLDLNDNRIEDEGCKNLAKASLPNLRTLLICRNKMKQKGLLYLSIGEWPLLAFVQAKENSFEPNKQLQKTKFRSEVKVFRLEIH